MSDEHEQIPAHRLALHIEGSVQQALAWVALEANTEELWRKVRADVEAFMHGIFSQGALKGSTAREAYTVRCGPDTMTQSDIDAGRLNVVIGIAAVKPAEFVIIAIQLLTAEGPDDANRPPRRRWKKKP